MEKEYRKAIYAIYRNGGETIFRIGEFSETVDAILDEFHAAVFAFITAYNPRSEILTDEENAARQDDLRKLLKAENFEFLEGYGGNENENWKREKSLFIFDISREKALEIGVKFEQNAIVYGEKGREVELIWC